MRFTAKIAEQKCPESEVQVTNVSNCEECGEVPVTRFKSMFPGDIHRELATKNPPCFSLSKPQDIISELPGLL